MIKIISKKEYENLIQEIETLRDELKKEEKDHIKEMCDYQVAKNHLRYEISISINELQGKSEEEIKRLIDDKLAKEERKSFFDYLMSLGENKQCNLSKEK